ncbi:MAG TPA: porin family protein [Bacteroidia bacterium]|nr:porin family protein [Bacteroidia bacterium]HNU34609.1 porin family protein [Bacteroidia bacterium]
MKKIILGLFLVAASVVANAQSFRVGLAGGYNSTWLFNKTVSDAGDELDYASSFGGQIGVHAMYSFKEKLGLSVDILSNTVNQKYDGDAALLEQVQIKYVSVPVLLKFMGEKGPYFEVGPEFSFRGKVKAAALNGDLEELESDIVDEFYNKSNISAVIGFGVDIKASEQIAITAGLRFAWGVSDVTKEIDGDDDYEPTNTAVGGLHLGVSYIFPSK